MTVEKWKAELAILAPQERAEIAHFLLDSLEEAEDPHIDAAWDRELERRCEEIRRGEVTGISAEDVFSRIREKYS